MITTQERASSGKVSTIVRRLNWVHHCRFMGVSQASCFYMTQKCTPFQSSFSELFLSSHPLNSATSALNRWAIFPVTEDLLLALKSWHILFTIASKSTDDLYENCLYLYESNLKAQMHILFLLFDKIELKLHQEIKIALNSSFPYI